MEVTELNQSMEDGTVLFAVIPGLRMCSWTVLKEHLLKLQGLALHEFIQDQLGEGWLDFSFMGQRFSVHGSEADDEYRFFLGGKDIQETDLFADVLSGHLRKL